MSQNSNKQNYQAAIEWLEWARMKYPAFRKKRKKKPAQPRFVDYD